MTTFLQTAASRETSPEIMEAINWLAGADEKTAELLWTEPTFEELLAIWERATKNGLIPAANFTWGATGSQWADDLQLPTSQGEEHAILLNSTIGIVEFERAVQRAASDAVSEETTPEDGRIVGLTFADGSRIALDHNARAASIEATKAP